MAGFSAPPKGTIEHASSSNPISALFRSIVGVFIGILVLLFLAPVVLWFAESQDSAKVFSHAKQVDSGSGATGFIRTSGAARGDSAMPCFEGKVSGNCIYYDYTLEALSSTLKDHCGQVSSDQKIVEEKGQKCHRDGNDEEVCEQCYVVNESRWESRKHVYEFRPFSIGSFRVPVPRDAKLVGSKEYQKQIDAVQRERMSYLVDGSDLLIAGSSDGSALTDGGKKKYLLVSSLDYENTYSALQSQDRIIAWILRFITFVVLLVGYSMLFGPISVMSNIVRKIPFIGTFIDNAVGSVIFGISLLLAILHFIALWILIIILKNIVLIAIVVAIIAALIGLYVYMKKE